MLRLALWPHSQQEGCGFSKGLKTFHRWEWECKQLWPCNKQTMSFVRSVTVLLPQDSRDGLQETWDPWIAFPVFSRCGVSVMIRKHACFPGRAVTPVRMKSGPLRSWEPSWMRSLVAGQCRWPHYCCFLLLFPLPSCPVLLLFPSLLLKTLLSLGFLWAPTFSLTSPSCRCLCSPLPLMLLLSSSVWLPTVSVSSGCRCSYNHSGILPQPSPPRLSSPRSDSHDYAEGCNENTQWYLDIVTVSFIFFGIHLDLKW